MGIWNFIGLLIAAAAMAIALACGAAAPETETNPDHQSTVTAAVQATLTSSSKAESNPAVATSEAASPPSQSEASLCSEGKRVKTKPNAIYELSLEQRQWAVCLRQSGQLWVPLQSSHRHAEVCNKIKREYDTAVVEYLIEGSPLFSAQTKGENYIESVMERTPQRFTPRETRSIMEDCGNLIYGKPLPPNLFFYLEPR